MGRPARKVPERTGVAEGPSWPDEAVGRPGQEP